jgi:hypothetical protein
MTEKSSPKSVQSTPSTSTTQTGQNSASATAREMADEAKEKVSDVASQAKEAVSDVASQAREQATSQVVRQKDRAAEGLGSLAQALRHTSEELRTQDQLGITGYVESAADRVEHFSNYLRERDIGEMVNEVERFARRQPALFLGGAFVLGLIGARFLKSSGQQGMRYPLAQSQYYQPGPNYSPTYERAVGSNTSQYGPTTSTRYESRTGGAED